MPLANTLTWLDDTMKPLTSTTWSTIKTRRDGKDSLSVPSPHCLGSVATAPKNFADDLSQSFIASSRNWDLEALSGRPGKKSLTEKIRVREVIKQTNKKSRWKNGYEVQKTVLFGCLVIFLRCEEPR